MMTSNEYYGMCNERHDERVQEILELGYKAKDVEGIRVYVLAGLFGVTKDVIPASMLLYGEERAYRDNINSVKERIKESQNLISN